MNSHTRAGTNRCHLGGAARVPRQLRRVIRPARPLDVLDVVDPDLGAVWASNFLAPLATPDASRARAAWATWVTYGGSVPSAAAVLGWSKREMQRQVCAGVDLVDPGQRRWSTEHRARGWLALVLNDQNELGRAESAEYARTSGYWRLLVPDPVATWASEHLAPVLARTDHRTELTDRCDLIAGLQAAYPGAAVLAAWLDAGRCPYATADALGSTGRALRPVAALFRAELGDRLDTPAGEYRLRLAANALLLR